MKNQFTPRPLSYPLTISLNHTPTGLFIRVTNHSKNPPASSSFQPSSLPLETVTAGNKQRDTAYLRRGRSGEERGWIREVLAVTSRCDSSTMMAGIGQAMCAGSRARRRRTLRPAHGGVAQSNGTGSFTGC
jgi:hypothetical protein